MHAQCPWAASWRAYHHFILGKGLGRWVLKGLAMSEAMRATLLTMLAAAPLWAVASNELPAPCAQQPTSGPCVLWLAVEVSPRDANPAGTNALDASPAAASFDRLSSPRAADASALPVIAAAATEPARSPVHAAVADVATLGANAAPGHSFKGIPLGFWFTALVVLAYALRRCERVWPRQPADEGTAQGAYLTTEAGRL